MLYRERKVTGNERVRAEIIVLSHMRINETLHGPGGNLVWELSFGHGECGEFGTGSNADGASIGNKTQSKE